MLQRCTYLMYIVYCESFCIFKYYETIQTVWCLESTLYGEYSFDDERCLKYSTTNVAQNIRRRVLSKIFDIACRKYSTWCVQNIRHRMSKIFDMACRKYWTTCVVQNIRRRALFKPLYIKSWFLTVKHNW